MIWFHNLLSALMTRALSISTHRLFGNIRVGSWYYTMTLRKYCGVTYYTNAPLSPYHFLVKRDGEFWSKLKLLFGSSDNCSDLVQHQCFSFFPAATIWPFNTSLFFYLSYRLSYPKLKIKKYDVVYVDNPYFFSIAEGLDCRCLVVRFPDLIPVSSGFKDSAIYQVILNMVNKADLIICANINVRAQIRQHFYKDSVIIGNGVDLSRFKKGSSLVVKKSNRRRRIVFVGVFDYWVDYNYINSLSEFFPDIDILLIGPSSKMNRKLFSSNNICHIGPKSPTQVVTLLNDSDVGIVPFDIKNHKEFVDGINPLKVYEYLAAGIPVVSTDFAGARGISPYVTTAATPEAFCQAVADYLDNLPDRDAVRKTAEPYDWSVVLKPFEDFVKKSLENSEE